jgi:hypothetical protein
MTYAPQNPVDVPPFQLQRLIPDVLGSYSMYRVFASYVSISHI